MPSLTYSAFDNGNRDLLKPPEDLIDVSVGSGRWQILVTLILSFTVFIHLLNTGNETLLRPSGWWCKKPNFLGDWTDVQWILYSHNKDSCVGICNRRSWSPEMLADGYFQGCLVYDVNYESLRGIRYSERPIIQTNLTIPCPYGVHYSAASGQSLAQKYKRACSNGTIVSNLWLSSGTFGRIAGYIVFGTLGDWIGRKIVIFIACGMTPITALIVATSSDYTTFIVASLIHGFFHGGFALSMVLILEISTNAWRTGLLAISCSSFALGIGLTPIINSIFESYDQMMVFINLLNIVVFISTDFLPESPAWLFCTRDVKRLEKIIGKAAGVNRYQSSTTFRLVYVDHNDEKRRLHDQMPRVWSLMLQPEVTCQIIGIIYLTGLFGLMFGGDFYAVLENVGKSQVANALLALSTTFGMLIGQLCTLLMGHRRILRISICLVFVSSFMLVIKLHYLKPSITGPTMTLLLVNVALVSLSYGVLLNYNTRTFPTLLRGTLCGIFGSTWSIAVWAGNHNYVHFPRITIALVICCILAGLYTINLRELHQRELPDTITDCIRFKVQAKPKRWDITEPVEDSQVDEISYVSSEKPSNYLNSVGRFTTKKITGSKNLLQDRRISPRH